MMSKGLKEFDVGFPSVCCKYHWLIKKLFWAFIVNRGRRGKLGRMKGEVRKVMDPLPETDMLKLCW